MSFFIGIDCGTQGTKVIIYDAVKRQIVSSGSARHKLISQNDGLREQEPRWWIIALDIAMKKALASFYENKKLISAIGVSGQQHGLVVLDKERTVLYNAKLWNDTSTALENDILVEQAGGISGVIKKIGTAIPVGYTASKLIWLKRYKPQIFSQIAYVMNPKDFINFYLTGVICTDFGSASGTGFFNVLKKEWSQQMLDVIDPSGVLTAALPTLFSEDAPIGYIRPEIAKKYGLSKTCKVSIGSGDNMAAAIGTGCIKNGVGTITLGTSGVLSIFTDKTPVRYPSIVQIQNLLSKSWIPTICTMNATSTTTCVQSLFGLDIETFDRKLKKTTPGANGVSIFPFFNGERMPPLPCAKGIIAGLACSNFTQDNIIRASAEAVAFCLKWGYSLLKKKGINLYQMSIVGGGSNSMPWQQIISDVFNVELVSPANKEAGALGAAILAMNICKEEELSTLCDIHIRFTKQKIKPKKEHVFLYEDIYNDYIESRNFFYKLK
ncbi:xylulokinase [Treponema sp. OMZ 840]|uniref:xylulokinase n=1 Tax=Treponema sp. OMZ 840 TaxID=244313 RepID=UPI003D945EB4